MQRVLHYMQIEIQVGTLYDLRIKVRYYLLKTYHYGYN